MGTLGKWVTGLFMVAYVLSPVDFIPDMILGAGWMDDLAVVAMVLYFLWTGRLPVLGKEGPFSRTFRTSGTGQQGSRRTDSGSTSSENHRENKEGKASETPEDPYSILGIARGAGKKEIREAYRKAAQAYHPDHVAHLGPELQALARQKFIEIKDAYEYLIKITDKP